MGSKAGNLLKIAAPIALSFALPGIGSALGLGANFGLGTGVLGSLGAGAISGGLGSAITGGNILKGALTGGASAGLGNGLGRLGDYAGITGEGGIFGSSGSGLTNSQLDSGARLTGGAIPNPTSSVGEIAGGASSSYGSGKSIFDDLSNGISDKYHDLFGNAAGSSLDTTSGMSGLQGPTDGTGVGGFLSKNLNSGGIMGSSTSGNPLTSLLSAGLGTYSNDKAQDALLKQQQANTAMLSPFLSAKFDPGDLASDPGYQFQLQQGTQALDRKNAASGNYFSGAALQGAQDYGQGLASTTYGDAYNRFLQGQQQKLGAASALAGVNDNVGNINAGAITNSNNLLSGALGGLLGGTALSNTGTNLSDPSNALLLKYLQGQQNQSAYRV